MMNRKQIQVNKRLLNEEKAIIKLLRDCYAKAYKDLSEKILKLSDDPDMISKIHQKKYNQVLRKQIKETMDLLDNKKVTNIDDFLNKTAETSFIGTLYEFNNDVPLLLPIDNKSISAIINKKVNDFSFSERLHKDTKKLTDVAVNEIGRGFSTGMSFEDMALNIKNRFTHDMNNAFRIAQTEGHRVSQESAYDTAHRFKEKGADIVKQWDSTMDKKTRPHHVKLDGQIRELDDPFEVEGHKAMYPGAFGRASEDIRCRCVMVKRARWALEDYETKWDGDKDKLVRIKAKGYDEFKQKYEKAINTPAFELVDVDHSKSFKAYSSNEIMDMAAHNEGILNQYDLPSSKWSGRIIYEDDPKAKLPFGKLWSCDIRTSHTTSPHIMLHEQLHARSISHYDKLTYIQFKNIEEASVQFLTQEMSIKQNIEILAGGYEELVDNLRKINNTAGLYNDDITFAAELFKQPVVSRTEWLETKIYDRMVATGSMEDMEAVMHLLEDFY